MSLRDVWPPVTSRWAVQRVHEACVCGVLQAHDGWGIMAQSKRVTRRTQYLVHCAHHGGSAMHSSQQLPPLHCTDPRHFGELAPISSKQQLTAPCMAGCTRAGLHEVWAGLQCLVLAPWENRCRSAEVLVSAHGQGSCMFQVSKKPLPLSPHKKTCTLVKHHESR